MFAESHFSGGMVHNLIELDKETRDILEKGGGTKAATKLILVKWQETGRIPVCLPAPFGAEPTVLPPLQPNMLPHATFDTTGDLEELAFPRPLRRTACYSRRCSRCPTRASRWTGSPYARLRRGPARPRRAARGAWRTGQHGAFPTREVFRVLVTHRIYSQPGNGMEVLHCVLVRRVCGPPVLLLQRVGQVASSGRKPSTMVQARSAFLALRSSTSSASSSSSSP